MSREEILAQIEASRRLQANIWRWWRYTACGGCLLIVLILAWGLGMVWWRDQTRPYRVLHTIRLPGQILCEVRVPPGSRLSEMGRWTRELQDWERPDRRFVVNFYDDEPSDASFVAQAADERITPMRADVPP